MLYDASWGSGGEVTRPRDVKAVTLTEIAHGLRTALSRPVRVGCKLPQHAFLLKRRVHRRARAVRTPYQSIGGRPSAERLRCDPCGSGSSNVISEVVRVCGKAVCIVSQPVVGVCRNWNADRDGIPGIRHDGL